MEGAVSNILGKFDTDGDGVLTKDEIAAAFYDDSSVVFGSTFLMEVLDRDGDGQLTREEIAKGLEEIARTAEGTADDSVERSASRGFAVNKLDKDGKGHVTREEARDVLAAVLDLGTGGHLALITQMLNRLDLDGDSMVSNEEIRRFLRSAEETLVAEGASEPMCQAFSQHTSAMLQRLEMEGAAGMRREDLRKSLRDSCIDACLDSAAAGTGGGATSSSFSIAAVAAPAGGSGASNSAYPSSLRRASPVGGRAGHTSFQPRQHAAAPASSSPRQRSSLQQPTAAWASSGPRPRSLSPHDAGGRLSATCDSGLEVGESHSMASSVVHVGRIGSGGGIGRDRLLPKVDHGPSVGYQHSHNAAVDAGPEKSCIKCDAKYRGWGTTCSRCRRLGKSRSHQQCAMCGGFFAGLRVMCDDCVMQAAAEVKREREEKQVCNTFRGEEDNPQRGENNLAKRALEIFELCDSDGSGAITVDELEIGLKLGLFSDGMVPEDAMRAIMAVKKDGWSNVEWADGFTLLHWAAARDREKLVAHLLQSRADPAALDDSGQSAFDYAKARGCRRALAELTAAAPREAAACDARRAVAAKAELKEVRIRAKTTANVLAVPEAAPQAPVQRRHRTALSGGGEEALEAAMEVQEVAKEVQAQSREEHFKQLFYKLDLDGDGRLSSEEVAAAVKAGHLKELEEFFKAVRAQQPKQKEHKEKKDKKAPLRSEDVSYFGDTL